MPKYSETLKNFRKTVRFIIILLDTELSKNSFTNALIHRQLMEIKEGTKESESVSDIEENPRRCKFNNSLFSTKRCWFAARKETVLSCTEFVS